MNRRLNIVRAVHALGLALCFLQPVRAEPVRPVFHLDFENGLAPVISATVVTESEALPATILPPDYTNGVRGKAVFLGAKDQVLTIPAVERYLTGDAATLVFWVRKEAGAEYKVMHGAFGSMAQAWWQTMQKYDGGVDVPILSGTVGPPRWDMVAIASDARGRTVYRDGVKVAERGPSALKGAVVFGDSYGPRERGGQPAMCFDEILLFDRALNEKEVFELFLQTAADAVEPALRMLPSQAVVAVDGKVTPEEWGGAARAGGFVGAKTGFLAVTPTWVSACYDADNLYLALVSDTPKAALERVEDTIGMRGYVAQKAEKPGPAFLDDDRFRIVLARDYARPESVWELEFNNLRVAIAKKDGTEVATRAAIATSADVQAGWQAEVAIPWSELGGKPAEGAEMGFNVARIWKALQQTTDQWAVGVRRADGSTASLALGKLVAGKSAGIAARLLSTGNVTGGEVALAMELENRDAAIRMVNVAMASAHTTDPLMHGNLRIGDTAEYRRVETLSLSPGESKRLDFPARLKDAGTRQLTVRVASDGAALMHHRFPVFMGSLTQAQVAHYPSMERVRVRPDITRVPTGELAQIVMEAQLRREDGTDVLARGTVSAPTNAEAWIDLGTRGLPGGAYTIRYSVKQAGAETMGGDIPFRKKPLESFAWYGNDIGKRDVVPPPFTPIRREGGTLKVWHREYAIGDALLPKQIFNTVPEWSEGWVAAGDLEKPGSMSATLAAPIRLVVTGSNGVAHVSADGAADVQWGADKDTRASWTARQDVGPARVKAECFMEFDGFMWVDLTMEAADNIAAAVLELPFRPAWATLANYLEYHPRHNGKFPEKLEHEYKHPVPVWIGNEVGGSQWIVNTWHTEQHDFKNDRRLKEKTPGMILERRDDRHVVTVVLANTPVAKGETLRLRFGFITTPVKPIKSVRLAGSKSRFASISYSPYWNIQAHEFDPSHSIGSTIRLTDTPGGPMANGGTYVTIGRLRDCSPDAEYWADEFMGYPNTRDLISSYGRGIYNASTASASYRDYYVWWVAAEQAKRRRVAGSYYDTDVCQGASILEGRDLVSRIYLAFLESEDETAVQFHQSGMWFGAWQFSFNDSHLDGENFVSRLTKDKPGYHHHYPIDAFRAQLNSYQFGIPCATLDQFARSGAIPATAEAWAKWGSDPVDFFMALCYLHYDVSPAPAYAWQPFVKTWTDAAKESGLLSTCLPEDKFHPYWTQKIAAFPAGVYGSFYVVTAERRAILVAANYNEEVLTLSLPLDLARLGFQPGEKVSARAAAPAGARAEIKENTLEFTVGKAGGTLVVLDPAKEDARP